MIRRRRFLAGIAGALAASRLFGQGSSLPTICYLALATRESDARSVAAFRDGMREAGHVEGKTFVLADLYAGGDLARAEAMLREQLKRPVAAFLVPGAAAARLILRVTRTVPIVAVGLHPRGGQTDLFATLAKPGGMVTGVSNFGEELSAKRVQLLKEIMPRLRVVGVLHNISDPLFLRWGEETQDEIRAQGLAAMRLGLTSTALDALQRTLRGARASGVEAVVVVRDFLTAALHEPISRLTREFGLATIAEERRYPESGALLSYGASDHDLFRKAATYVDHVLKGARPAELAIELPTRFELVVNLKTAKVLGLTIPRSVLVRADEVIE